MITYDTAPESIPYPGQNRPDAALRIAFGADARNLIAHDPDRYSRQSLRVRDALAAIAFAPAVAPEDVYTTGEADFTMRRITAKADRRGPGNAYDADRLEASLARTAWENEMNASMGPQAMSEITHVGETTGQSQDVLVAAALAGAELVRGPIDVNA